MGMLDEMKRLAGITRSTRESWTLGEAATTLTVGEQVKASDSAGIDSGKQGKVLTVDGRWAQVRTSKGEMLWLPSTKLQRVTAEDK